ncbi:MAG: NupC/NupG family nucleoside CNT transporter [Sphingomonas sp.]|nr:NupC/NupG family nucleoside CNT transporter [Sphingomonas sp.]
MNRFAIGMVGIVIILALAVLLSSNRRAIRLRVVGAAFALQAAVAVLVLYVPAGRAGVQAMSNGVVKLLDYSKEGSKIIFGAELVASPYGAGFAISALPAVVFFAALIAILYYYGVMQLIVKWIGGAIRLVTGISRVESLGAAANIFVGQSESPLVIRPYLAAMTPSQIFAVMTVGLAGVAGTILVLYFQVLGPLGPQLLPYLVAASFMSAPGGILMAKIIMPDDPAHAAADPVIEGPITFGEERPVNIFMAAADGAQTGVKLAVAIAAMVLAFTALVALANGVLGGVGGWIGYPDITFQRLLGYVFAPLMFLLGVPWAEALQAGGLFGTKIVLNEVVAFIQLGQEFKSLSPRTIAIVTFSLCGFANFLSIAIQIAVTGGLAPNQRPVIARLGLRALAAASLSNLMSAALAGLLIG